MKSNLNIMENELNAHTQIKNKKNIVNTFMKVFMCIIYVLEFCVDKFKPFGI